MTKRFVWNYYNRIERILLKTESTTSWTYATVAWRSLNNSTANRIEIITGVLEEKIFLKGTVTCTNGAVGSWGAIGIGEDTTTDNSCYLKGLYSANGIGTNGEIFSPSIITDLYPASIGYHYYQLVELVDSVSNTITFYGNSTATLKERTTGINGSIKG